MSNNPHKWKFARIGGVDRVLIQSGKDITSLETLDQKLWTALACPAEGLVFDKKTPGLLDTDNDGKIRVPEVIAATRWICSLVKNPDELVENRSEMPLESINTESEEGKRIYDSARQILVFQGKESASSISPEDTADVEKIFAGTKFNGDGVITEDSTDDTEHKQIIREIIDTCGSKKDRSAKDGIDREALENFYKSCNEYNIWFSESETDKDKIMPFAENTHAVYEAFDQIEEKIDDYFIRCKTVLFDSRSADILSIPEEHYRELAFLDLATQINSLDQYPLSRPRPDKTLHLNEQINPAWEARMNQFRKLMGAAEIEDDQILTADEWEIVKLKLIPYQEWLRRKPNTPVEKLGLERIRSILSSERRNEISNLIDQDASFAEEADAVFAVDKMVRFYCYLNTLLNNFVSFYDFYSPAKSAVFQYGTLFIDRRSCDFCLKVNDMPKHAAMAHLSGMYLLYCDCVSKVRNEKITIVAGVTDGDVDNLYVGRNGVFYDREGQDWDAVIVKIVENPISIRQAFWSPYKKFVRMIEEQVQKFAANREKSVEQSASANIEKTGTTLAESSEQAKTTSDGKQTETAKDKKTQTAFDIGKYVGIFAAIGLAIGAIGTALASVITGFLSLTWWKMPIAVAGILLLISGPSMILAWMKLRKRNLAPVLDANAWAVNAQTIINIPFGNTLTHVARLPKNASRTLKDPFSSSKISLWLILAGIAIISAAAYFLWYYGYLKAWGINI